jgi:hypothetical protein
MSPRHLIHPLPLIPESFGKEDTIHHFRHVDIVRNWICGCADSHDVGAGDALRGTGV